MRWLFFALVLMTGSMAVATDGYGLVWEKSFLGGSTVELFDVAVDASNNVYVAGKDQSSSIDARIYVWKYDSQGNFKWSYNITGDANGQDRAVRMLVDSAGNPYVLGKTYNLINGLTVQHYYLARLNPTTGAVVWDRTNDYFEPHDFAIIGNGDANSRIGVCGARIGVNERAAEYEEINASNGTQLYAALWAYENHNLKNYFHKIIVDSNRFVMSAISNGRAGLMTVDGNLATSTAIIDATVQVDNPSVVRLTPSGDYGYVGRMDLNGFKKAYMARVRASDLTLKYKSFVDMPVDNIVPGALAQPNDAVVTSICGQLSSYHGTALLTLNSNGAISKTYMQTYLGITTPTCLIADFGGSVHVGQNLEVPEGSNPFLSVLSPRGNSQKFVSTLVGSHVNALAADRQGYVYAVGRRDYNNVDAVGYVVKLALYPTAVNDAYGLRSGESLVLAAPGVLANDFGGLGAIVSLGSVAPQHGALGLNTNGTFTYTPFANYWGQDTFKYSATKLEHISSATVTLTIRPPLKTFTVSASTVVGSASPTGTVSLASADSYGDSIVALSDNSTSVSVPPTVTILKSASSATFTISTAPVDTTQTVTLTAILGPVTKSVTISVVPPSISSLVLTPNSVKGGLGFSGTVTTSANVYALGATVQLTDNGPDVTVPASVTIPGGTKTATFNGTTTIVTATQTRTVIATYGTSTKTATLTITP